MVVNAVSVERQCVGFNASDCTGRMVVDNSAFQC